MTQQGSEKVAQLLLDKEQEWSRIAHLCRLIGINPSQAAISAKIYHDARAYGQRPSVLCGSGNYVAEDVDSILTTGNPLFESIHGIAEYEERRDAEAARQRQDADAKIAAEKQRMNELRKRLEQHLKADGSELKVHEVDDRTVQILLDGYESRKGRK